MRHHLSELRTIPFLSGLGLLLFMGLGCSGASELQPDADSGDTECVPKTCSDFGLACGTFDDGCGDRVVCEESCGCSESDYQETCPERPCEIAFGCHAGRCAYRPVTCSDIECLARPCEGEGCEVICSEQGCDGGLYPCSNSQSVCAGVTRYCDPAPKLVDGKISYQNQCIPAPKRGCGICELGATLCDEAADRFTCEEPPMPAETRCAEDFVYLDPTYSEGHSDGSKEKPFLSYAQAVSTAKAEGKAAIIIGGSPTFTEQLRIEEGVSIYGGFTLHPEFRPDPSARPSWEIAASAQNFDSPHARLVGMIADGVREATIIRGIRVETRDASSLRDAIGNGASNIAGLIHNSRGVALHNVELIAGHGANGEKGADGAPAGGDMQGRDASERHPGAPAPACSAECVAAKIPSASDFASSSDQEWLNYDQRCGAGAARNLPAYVTGENEAVGGRRAFGNSGNPIGAPEIKGGEGGENPCDQPWCFGGEWGFKPGTLGGDGEDGTAGATGSIGADASPGAMDAQGIWRSANPAQTGSSGTAGRWGGGGGAGGAVGGSNQPLYGGAGGGGGSPGCGGNGGEGGKLGGASIALLLTSSQDISVRGSVLRSATAGSGGQGGKGAPGGAGGAGADGGWGDSHEGGEPGENPFCEDYGGFPCPKRGGKGGKGGKGGDGGGGGAGAGGDSNAIRCVNSSNIEIGGNALNIGLAGAAGVGGNPAIAGEASLIKGCD